MSPKTRNGGIAIVGTRGERAEAVVWMLLPNGLTKKLPHIIRHSPYGFEWGYTGSGPADLAYAILAEVVGKDAADQLAEAFEARVIRTLPKEGFILTVRSVVDFTEDSLS